MSKLLAKLSAKSMGINVQMEIAKNAKGKDAPVAIDNAHNKFLMRVVGTASGIKTGISNFGEWVVFLGQHEAINIETGEVKRAGKIFLPNIASNLLQGAVQGAEGKPVSYAFDIGVTPNVESSVGYEWSVVPIMEVAENDPLEMLKASLTGAPALPAPTKKVDDSATTETSAPDAKPESGNDSANVTSAPAKPAPKKR